MNPIRLKSMTVDIVKKQMYIVDPALVPPELKDKNILVVDQPISITALDLEGEEIVIILEENSLTINQRVIPPEG